MHALVCLAWFFLFGQGHGSVACFVHLLTRRSHHCLLIHCVWLPTLVPHTTTACQQLEGHVLLTDGSVSVFCMKPVPSLYSKEKCAANYPVCSCLGRRGLQSSL